MRGDAEATLCLVATNYPNLSTLVEKIRLYLTSKLYHELTDALTVLLSDNCLSCDVKIQVFETLVHPLKDSFNGLKFCALLRFSSESLEPKEALEYLCKYDSFLEKDIETHLMLQISKAYHYVKNGQLKKCDSLLDTVGEKINETMNLDISVHSAYYQASAFMNRANKNYSQCYKDWIMYLSYTSLNSIAEEEREDIAVTITICAIVAPDSFGFGELIHQPIIECYLKGGSKHWLYELLHIFNEGHLQLFDEALERYKGKIVHTELAGCEEKLRHKLTLISLLNLVFRKSNKQRCIHFQEIVEQCDIKLHQVEPLVLQALALRLVRGHIDQVQQTFHVTWVQPRILDSNKLEIVRQRINDWISVTKELVCGLERLAANVAS